MIFATNPEGILDIVGKLLLCLLAGSFAARTARYFGAPMEVRLLAFALIAGIAFAIWYVGGSTEEKTDARQIGCLYSPTSGCVRSTLSTALNMSRIRASDTGLSTTTTNSGLFDDARTRPQVPSSTVTRTPLTVTRSRMPCPATLSPFFLAPSKCATTLSTMPYLISSSQCGEMVGDDKVFGSALFQWVMLLQGFR